MKNKILFLFFSFSHENFLIVFVSFTSTNFEDCELKTEQKCNFSKQIFLLHLLYSSFNQKNKIVKIKSKASLFIRNLEKWGKIEILHQSWIVKNMGLNFDIVFFIWFVFFLPMPILFFSIRNGGCTQNNIMFCILLTIKKPRKRRKKTKMMEKIPFFSIYLLDSLGEI